MVEAWFMDDSDDDQRQPHKTDPPRFVSPEDLLASTGVESFKVLKIASYDMHIFTHLLVLQISIDETLSDPSLAKIRKERGYSYEDEITCCPEKLPNYEQKVH
jgi:1,2-dihydroxy-3-keto-5-methylthiopentene dioxygenase